MKFNLEHNNSSQPPLRPHEIECVEKIISLTNAGHHRVGCDLGPFTEKLIIFNTLISRLLVRTLIVSHSIEFKNTLTRADRVGLVDATHTEFDRPVVITSLPCAKEPHNLEKLIEQDFRLLIFNECHHDLASSAEQLFCKLGFGPGINKTKLLVVFTAGLLHESDGETSAMGKTQKIPAGLDPKLKSVLLNFSPLGTSYSWAKFDRSYILRGASMTIIIEPQPEDHHLVFVIEGPEVHIMATGLSFECALAAAESFAKKQKKNFSLNDRDASWRSDPITDKQLAYFKRKQFETGVDELSRGQAYDLIGSGVLNSVKKKRKVSGR